MSYSRRARYSPSPAPYRSDGRPASRPSSRSTSPSWNRESSDAENPGNNLYVTGLSPRITKRELEKHFSSEGTVVDVHLVVDPWTRHSRGFGFVTMSNVEEANRCIKYLDRSALEGRVITVEKARRRRGRTPTPGKYLGLRTVRVRRRSPTYSPYARSRSGSYSSEGSRSRSYSPHYSRHRSYTPRRSRHSSYSPYYIRGRTPSRSRSPYAKSSFHFHYCSPDDCRCGRRYYSPDDPCYRGRYRSPDDRRDSRCYYTPDDDRCYRGRCYYLPDDDRHYRGRYYSPDDRRYRGRYHSPDDDRHHIRRYYSPDDGHYRGRYRSVSRSISPRRSYSCSYSPRSRRSVSLSPSVSPSMRRSSRRGDSRSTSLRPRKPSRESDSYRSRSRSESVHASSRLFSRSVTPCSSSG